MTAARTPIIPVAVGLTFELTLSIVTCVICEARSDRRTRLSPANSMALAKLNCFVIEVDCLRIFLLELAGKPNLIKDRGS
ncbi:hypothetical protein AYI70_g3537 [Smittium culicis]|uniref:Uncharacterized protein n=1 Tax=Smittium culicis TaxID=133412 RepID=A0A1R1Y3M9_9FUNG|nr:hypothetical protein AYI70_g3537 [Smittium culicis]